VFEEVLGRHWLLGSANASTFVEQSFPQPGIAALTFFAE
jgi:hypothetical protein